MNVYKHPHVHTVKEGHMFLFKLSLSVLDTIADSILETKTGEVCMCMCVCVWWCASMYVMYVCMY